MPFSVAVYIGKKDEEDEEAVGAGDGMDSGSGSGCRGGEGEGLFAIGSTSIVLGGNVGGGGVEAFIVDELVPATTSACGCGAVTVRLGLGAASRFAQNPPIQSTSLFASFADSVRGAGLGEGDGELSSLLLPSVER